MSTTAPHLLLSLPIARVEIRFGPVFWARRSARAPQVALRPRFTPIGRLRICSSASRLPAWPGACPPSRSTVRSTPIGQDPHSLARSPLGEWGTKWVVAISEGVTKAFAVNGIRQVAGLSHDCVAGAVREERDREHAVDPVARAMAGPRRRGRAGSVDPVGAIGRRRTQGAGSMRAGICPGFRERAGSLGKKKASLPRLAREGGPRESCERRRTLPPPQVPAVYAEARKTASRNWAMIGKAGTAARPQTSASQTGIRQRRSAVSAVDDGIENVTFRRSSTTPDR